MKNGPDPSFEVRVRAVEAVIMNGESVADVAETLNLNISTIYKWIKRYNTRKDIKALEHQKGAGPPQKISPLEQCELVSIVLKPASEFGFETDLWTCKRLQIVLMKNMNKKVSDDTILRMLRDWGFTYQKPEKRYSQASPEKKNEWIRDTLPEIRKKVRKYKAILYFEDECNISLTAVTGKTWAPEGKTPFLKMTGARASISAISAISNSGRLHFALHDRTIKSGEIIDFLKQLLKEHPRRHLVVVMDQARPHVSKLTESFCNSQPRLYIFHLPPYSPELNPDEKVWIHLKNIELKAHRAQNKTELKELSEKKLNSIAENPGKVKALFARSEMDKIMR